MKQGNATYSKRKRYRHTKDRNIVHLLTMNIKDSLLGSIQNIFYTKGLTTTW